MTKIKDHEQFIRKEILEISNKVDKDKLSQENKLFVDEMARKLRLENGECYQFIMSSLDDIGDTIEAFGAFEKHSSNDISLNYLTIYGLLSAVYIQQQAIIGLAEIFNLDKLEDIKNKFRNLEITKLRHYIAAHPINYKENNKKTSFKLDRTSLRDGFSKIRISNQQASFQEYNIPHLLEENNEYIEKLMQKICSKLISNVYSRVDADKEIYDILYAKLQSISS